MDLPNRPRAIQLPMDSADFQQAAHIVAPALLDAYAKCLAALGGRTVSASMLRDLYHTWESARGCANTADGLDLLRDWWTGQGLVGREDVVLLVVTYSHRDFLTWCGAHAYSATDANRVRYVASVEMLANTSPRWSAWTETLSARKRSDYALIKASLAERGFRHYGD